MTAAIIYHSETGTTRRIARFLQEATGGDLIAVKSAIPYGPVTRRLIGGRRAFLNQRDPILPPTIEAGGYDLLVIGSPVWMRHPTPAIASAIDRLCGAEGKDAVIFATCCLSSLHARQIMAAMLEAKGVRVIGSIGFSASEIGSREKRAELEDLVRQVSTASPA
jgi:hypothetical protein